MIEKPTLLALTDFSTEAQKLAHARHNIDVCYQDLVQTVDEAKHVSFYTKNQFYRFLNNNSQNFFDRHNSEGHITSSAFVVDETRTKMLLVLHKKLGKWLQTGGHWDAIDTNPVSLFENAIKELQEEAYGQTVIDYKDLNNNRAYHLDIHGVGTHRHFDIGYLLEMDSTIPLSLSFESLDVAWIDFEYIQSQRGTKEFGSDRLHEVMYHIDRLENKATMPNPITLNTITPTATEPRIRTMI